LDGAGAKRLVNTWLTNTRNTTNGQKKKSFNLKDV